MDQTRSTGKEDCRQDRFSSQVREKQQRFPLPGNTHTVGGVSSKTLQGQVRSSDFSESMKEQLDKVSGRLRNTLVNGWGLEYKQRSLTKQRFQELFLGGLPIFFLFFFTLPLNFYYSLDRRYWEKKCTNHLESGKWKETKHQLHHRVTC